MNESGGIGKLFADREDAAAAFDAIARGEQWDGRTSVVTAEGRQQTRTHRMRPTEDDGEFCAVTGYVAEPPE